MLECVIMKMEG